MMTPTRLTTRVKKMLNAKEARKLVNNYEENEYLTFVTLTEELIKQRATDGYEFVDIANIKCSNTTDKLAKYFRSYGFNVSVSSTYTNMTIFWN